MCYSTLFFLEIFARFLSPKRSFLGLSVLSNCTLCIAYHFLLFFFGWGVGGGGREAGCVLFFVPVLTVAYSCISFNIVFSHAVAPCEREHRSIDGCVLNGRAPMKGSIRRFSQPKYGILFGVWVLLLRWRCPCPESSTPYLLSKRIHLFCYFYCPRKRISHA